MTKSATQIIIPIKNGKMPLKMSCMGTSLATLPMAKTFTPMGGVICPISIVRTVTTPNQIGSKPKAVIAGKMVGKTSSIIGITFKRQPRMIKKMITAPNIKNRLICNPVTNSASTKGNRVAARK